jgi:DNA-binding LacI/PurR family transcriptional regulator
MENTDAYVALDYLLGKGVTTLEIAAKTEISRSTISRWINGHSAPSPSCGRDLVKFAKRKGWRPNGSR